MVREIMKSPFFLQQKSQPATAADAKIADDLRDTLEANRHRCVGMAANMIGELKCIIVYNDEGTLREMFNPEIVGKSGEYHDEEGCLSLPGERPVTRYENITVKWQTRDMKPQVGMFSGFTAQIIQHEIDHCNGILV